MKSHQTYQNKMIKTWQFRQDSASGTHTLICNRRKPIAAYRCLSFSYHRNLKYERWFQLRLCRHLHHKQEIWTANMKSYQTCQNKMIKTWQFRQDSASGTHTQICNRRKPIAAYRCLSFSYHRELKYKRWFQLSLCRHLHHIHEIWTANMKSYQTCQNKMIKTWQFRQDSASGTHVASLSLLIAAYHFLIIENMR
jgi:hypothetical protein